ncbi:MAG: hypothetical protein HYU56_01880 [Candidatus Aenigmarchaeota archaeon]|nr:hypothetical protein [Candidatus Aenigmarchaeota archaeon]
MNALDIIEGPVAEALIGRFRDSRNGAIYQGGFIDRATADSGFPYRFFNETQKQWADFKIEELRYLERI